MIKATFFMIMSLRCTG